MTLLIRDIIDVPPVQTVIRLEEGTSRSREITSSFVATEEVAAHLTIFSDALQSDTGRGFFLEGDFGSGKSHFLAALSAWVAGREGTDVLERSVPALAECSKNGKRFLAVDCSLVRYRSATPFERIITGAVEKALAANGHTVAISPIGRFRDYLSEILRAPSVAASFKAACNVTPEALADWFARQPHEAYGSSIAFLKKEGISFPEALVEERHVVFKRALDAVHAAGFAGMVLVIDELSEFFRSKADPAALNEDARTLQLLGELTGSHPLWIIAAVQESIERTGDIASATFRKIKDRFPVRFHLSTLHLRDLIARRLVRHKPGASEKLLALYREYKRHFPAFTCQFDHYEKIYPVHPETLRLLEGLGNLFSQHRGIVDFVHCRVAGDPGRGIPGILDRDAGELLAPDAIYEHFCQRLAEFSAYHLFPRTIVPHLYETIDHLIDETEDCRLAKRLVRILVLYAIHPTARKPNVRELAALGACMLSDHDPDANAQFIAGVLLDPLTAQSRYLVKRPGPSGDPLDAVYELTAQEDLAGNLRQRIEKAIAEIRPGDTRLVLDPLAELPPSMSWPGPGILRECSERTVTWRGTNRTALVVFVQEGDEEPLARKITDTLSSGRADFALAIVTGNCRFACRFTAVWRMGTSADGVATLSEYFATRTVERELHPTNPSHAPLIPLVKESLRRQEPAVRAALMEVFYAGTFDDPETCVDPSALQIRRFDRLLEAAAGHLLEERYPRFKEIAPRMLQPSSRLYQRIISEFVIPGSLSMSEARAVTLTEAIETMAAPLGLVEVKTGSYRFAPALGEHPFLSYVFSLLRGTGRTTLDEVCTALKNGPWGVPEATVEFLLVALACGGVIMLLRSGRALALEQLSLTAVDGADAVAPGEIVGEADRETLENECPFLAPQGGWPSFGLRQQREAWQSLVKMKTSFKNILEETTRSIGAMEEFEAFSRFDFEAMEEKVRRLGAVLSEVKVSYPAREGLERFCTAWRESGLVADDVELIRKTHRFFSRFSEKFIFIAHYLRHASVEQVCVPGENVATLRETVALMLNDPLRLVVPDEGVQLGASFDLFREEYSFLYQAKHREFYESQRPQKPDRAQQRMLDLFGRLSTIEQLDRPQGLDALLRLTDRSQVPSCSRPVFEELLRSPACGCGFSPGGQQPVAAVLRNEEFDRVFAAYRTILAAPRVIEPLTAHAYALRDMNAALASRLEKLCALLRDRTDIPAQPLLDLLDDTTITEIGRALSGSIRVERKGLSSLVNELSGRRLSPAKVRAAFDAWLPETGDTTLLSFDAPVLPETRNASLRPLWWPLLHPALAIPAGVPGEEEAAGLETALEAEYPAASLEKRFDRMETDDLVRFIVTEPMHTNAVRTAWAHLFDRCLRRESPLPDGTMCSLHYIRRTAAGIDGRLTHLRSFLKTRVLSCPDLLRARVHGAELWADEWATRDHRKIVESAIAALEKKAEDWFSGLAPQPVIDLADSPVVVIIDALPPDVWLEALPHCAALFDEPVMQWNRISSLPQTVPSMAALFGFAADDDPFDRFASIGAVYHTVSGDEQHQLVDLLPPLAPEAACIVRMNLLDSAAHGVSISLPRFPGTLATILIRHLPGLISTCKKQHRRLVLTADHGLSWKAGTLSHGRGGVFEEAVPRVEWA
ncbi:MAG: hypothetical protein JW863_14170 [Chitinispirillaceae bacterium]|nr:hypothetical protein [Chitinispirillaceae bacterium]